MTSVSSYKLHQCFDCGQRHILPLYGTINFTFGTPGHLSIKEDDLMVCQKCSSQRPLKEFPRIGTVNRPPPDNSSKTLRRIKKFLGLPYTEPIPHPAKLYPSLEKEPFDPDTYYPDWVKKNLIEEDYPLWFKELSSQSKK